MTRGVHISDAVVCPILEFRRKASCWRPSLAGIGMQEGRIPSAPWISIAVASIRTCRGAVVSAYETVAAHLRKMKLPQSPRFIEILDRVEARPIAQEPRTRNLKATRTTRIRPSPLRQTPRLRAMCFPSGLCPTKLPPLPKRAMRSRVRRRSKRSYALLGDSSSR